MNYGESSYQQIDLVVSKSPKETKGSYVFNTNKLGGVLG